MVVQLPMGFREVRDEYRLGIDIESFQSLHLRVIANMQTRGILFEQMQSSLVGDAYAPTLGTEWKETNREQNTSTTGLKYSFVTYTRV